GHPASRSPARRPRHPERTARLPSSPPPRAPPTRSAPPMSDASHGPPPASAASHHSRSRCRPGVPPHTGPRAHPPATAERSSGQSSLHRLLVGPPQLPRRLPALVQFLELAAFLERVHRRPEPVVPHGEHPPVLGRAGTSVHDQVV